MPPESRDMLVRSAVPTVAAERKLNPREAVSQVQAALKHIVRQVEQGCGSFRLNIGQPVRNKSTPPEKKKMVAEEICRQEEATRCAKAVSQAKRAVGCKCIEKKKLSWSEMWGMEADGIRFILGATYDVLQAPHNLSNWGWRPHMLFVPKCSFISTHSNGVKQAFLKSDTPGGTVKCLSV